MHDAIEFYHNIINLATQKTTPQTLYKVNTNPSCEHHTLIDMTK